LAYSCYLLVRREYADAIIRNKEPSSYELWAHVLLGHATIMMTMRYAHLAPEIARDAVRLLAGSADRRKTVAKQPQI